MKKLMKNRIFLVIITMIIYISGTLYAANIYYATDVIYSPSTGESMSVNDALNELYNEYGSCSPFKFVKIGNYVKMTPTSTSYTTDTSRTGYTSSQTLNPSELNLWRVIKINEDGTIEVVSEYTSSVSIYFRGQTGYQNFIGYLNEIASQYENSKYTIGSRIIGSNGQTAYIDDETKLTSTKAPWTNKTSDNSNEALGGGDTLYTTDLDLIQNTLGGLTAYQVGTKTTTSYWIGGRFYYYYGSSQWSFFGRFVDSNGLNRVSLWAYNSGFSSPSRSNAIRPILTLKSGLSATGSRTKDDSFVLQ